MECHTCYRQSSEISIYRCLFPNCRHSKRLYCASCAQTVHRNLSHQFQQTNVKQDVDAPNNHSHDQFHTECKDETTKESPNKSFDLDQIKSGIKKCEKAGRAASAIIASQNPVCATVGVVAQVAQVSYNYCNNEITDEHGNRDKKEYQRLLCKSSVAPVASFLCGAAAKAIFLTTGFGWIAAIGYGILGAVISQKAFDKYLPASSLKRKQLKETSLRIFSFFPEDLENEEIFNKKTVEKRYKKLAKKYHPDSKYGSKEKFQELEVYHRIVLSMLENDAAFPMVKFDENGIAYFDSTTQPKAIQYPPDMSPVSDDDSEGCLIM